MQKHFPGVVGLFLAGLLVSGARAAEGDHNTVVDVYIDLPEGIQAQGKGLSANGLAEVTTALVRLTERWPGAVRRVFLPLFADGYVLFHSGGPLFVQSPDADISLVKRMAAQLREQGVQVYGWVDVLRWARTERPAPPDVFVQRPDLQELNSQYGCDAGFEGKFASPFHPEVCSLLEQLLRDLWAEYPDLDGLLLNCRLRWMNYWATARRPARLTFAKKASILRTCSWLLRFPRSLPLTASGFAGVWNAWPIWSLGSPRPTQRSRGGKPLLVTGFANFYRWTPGQRNLLLQDRLRWLSLGYAQEVLLEAHWLEPYNRQAFALAKRLVDKLREGRVPCHPILETQMGNEPMPLDVQMRALQFQGFTGVYVVRVRSFSGAEALSKLVGQA